MVSLVRVLTLGTLIFFGVHGSAFSQQPAMVPAPSTAVQPAATPLAEQMLVLDRAFRDIVSAVTLGDHKQIRSSLDSMYGALEKTRQGLRAGTVKLPRNQARIKEFTKIDRAFQEKLKSLGRTAQHNNDKEMVRITKQLFDDCVQCHRIFRK